MTPLSCKVYAVAPLKLRGTRILYAANVNLAKGLAPENISLPGGTLPSGKHHADGLRELAAECGWAISMERYLYQLIHTAQDANGCLVHWYQLPFALPYENYKLAETYDTIGVPLKYLAALSGHEFLPQAMQPISPSSTTKRSFRPFER